MQGRIKLISQVRAMIMCLSPHSQIRRPEKESGRPESCLCGKKMGTVRRAGRSSRLVVGVREHDGLTERFDRQDGASNVTDYFFGNAPQEKSIEASTAMG